MTTKQKAENLVNVFTKYGETIEDAKINVVLMIDNIALKLEGHHKDAITSNFIEYWQEVKEVVENDF